MFIRFILAFAFVGFISSAVAQAPTTTKPSFTDMLISNCSATHVLLGGAVSPGCGPTPTRAGDIMYFNGANWVSLAGNNSGTQFLQQTAAGVPSWATVAGSGTVTSVTCFGVAITTAGTCVTLGQMPGTATNDNAATGNVGEYQVSSVVLGSAVALTNNVTANMTSLSLAAGDWDVEAAFYTANGGTTTFSFMEAAINGTSATLPTRAVDGTNGVKAGSNVFQNYSGAAGLNQTLVTMPTRVSLSGTTTIYAVVNATFAASTSSIFGTMRARRAR